MRAIGTAVALCFVLSQAFADSVSYTGDPYMTAPGSGSGSGGNVYFEYEWTPGLGGNPSYFVVLCYPDASGSDYSNINNPHKQGFQTQGVYYADLGSVVASLSGQSGIYWSGSAIYDPVDPIFTFSFQSSAHGVVYQGWQTNGTGVTSGPIEGPAPEPTTFALFGGGLLGLLGSGLRRRRARQGRA